MLEAAWQWRGDVQLFVLAVLCALAWWKGGAPEKILTSLFLATPVIDRIFHVVVGHGASEVTVVTGHLVMDLVILAVVMPVALQANRVYPLWIGAAQIVAMVSYITHYAMVHLNLIAYAIIDRMPSYLQIVALWFGLAMHVLRQRRVGSYPSWRS